MALSAFIRELRRRRVFRLAGIYLIGTWLLLQVADVTFAPIGLPPWAMTALVWVVVVGFPIALFLSWRYDLTSDGLVRIAPLRGAVADDQSLKPVDYGILVCVLLAAGLVTSTLIGHIRQRGEATTTLSELPIRLDAVAVLPFVNMSGVADDEYFSDGVAEEILNALAQVSQLKVIARTSSFAFKDQTTDIREIARRLGARNIVEGSVRRAGNRLRINAQLIDALSGTRLWSQSYDRELVDVFEVQEDIAEQIVVAMRAELGIALSEPAGISAATDNVEAYDRYLLGNHYYWQRGKEPVEKAIELFREAIELDPDFAPAWAALSAAYNSAPAHGVSIEGAHPHDLAEQAAERAIELDDTLGLAWMVLGNVKPRPRYRNFEAAAPYLMKAVEVSPYEPTVVHWMWEGMMGVGRLQEALRYAELGYELDPMSRLRSVALGHASMINGLYDRAVRLIDQARERGLYDHYIWNIGLQARLEARDFDAAEAWLAERPSDANEETLAADRAYLRARRNPSAGNIEHAAGVIMTAYRGHGDGPRIDGDHAFYLLASMGATDAAYELTDKRLDLGAFVDPTDWWLPSTRSFRTDPRFIELAEQLRLPGFWRQYGWPDECRPTGDSFVCG
jgi:TolB-like protein